MEVLRFLVQTHALMKKGLRPGSSPRSGAGRVSVQTHALMKKGLRLSPLRPLLRAHLRRSNPRPDEEGIKTYAASRSIEALRFKPTP